MVQLFQYLRNLADARVLSPNSDIRQGAQVFVIILLGLLTSHDRSSHHARRFALPMLSVFTLLLGTFLFSHSAYAASYLNVSSGAPGGTVTFSKVQPSSSGEMSTASDTLTVNTNCTVGYSVYVSAINGGDTNLTNDSASGNNTISASSATVGGTSAVLSANTWGINASSSDVSDGKYFGLPAYASATSSALTTRSNVAEQTTVPIYYGAKVTTAIAPGSYAGDVLYTVLPSSACTYYTVAFDANGGTGTMDNQTINVGENTALSENTFTRSGYAFLGWSNSANGKTGTASNGIGTMADVDYVDKQFVKDISNFNTTKTLYAIWAVLSGDMQTWTGCPSLSANSIVYLNDSRDNTVYAVKKLPDGKCWMIQNLTISATNLQVNSFNNTNTNVPNTDSNDYYLPPRNTRYATANSITNSAVKTASSSLSFTTTSSNQPQIGYKAAGTTDNSTGNPVPEDTAYYNFYTATLGFSYQNDGVTSGSSPRDICPKGWRLPWTSDAGTTRTTTADFYVLATLYNSDATWDPNTRFPTNGPYTSDATIRNNMISGDASSIDRFGSNGAAGFTNAGSYFGSALGGVGTSGHYWSSSVYDASRGYRLLFNTTNVYPQDSLTKNYGYAVRCVAQNNYTVSYNANGGTGAASKASDSIYETGEVTTAGQGTLAKEGYNFLGWSLDQNAASATYVANSSIDVQTLISAAGSPASGSTITLYAVWEKAIEAMQNWSSCDDLSVGEIITLKDSRDNNVYAIKKLKDNKCWMVENLKLTDYNLSPSDSNVSSDFDMTASKITQSESSGWCTDDTSSCYQNVSAYTYGNVKGSLYNWYTATAGTESANYDICPKGWRLPTGGPNGDFATLDIAFGGTGSGGRERSYYSLFAGAYTTGDNAGFSVGSWYINGSIISSTTMSSIDYYWSSTVNDSSSAYSLSLGRAYGDSRLYPQQSDSKRYYGAAVRCIAKAPTMQDFDASTSLPNVGDSTTLTDARDGTMYTVKRLADGKVWMTDNLILGYDAVKALTKDNTNIPDNDNSTYYLPKAGTRGNFNSATPTGTPTFDSNNDNQAQVQYRAQGQAGDQSSTGTLGQSTGYYNFYAATLGCSYYEGGASCLSGYVQKDICPKGWHLPTGGASGQFVALDIAMNGGTGANRYDATARDRFLNQASFLYSGYYSSSQLYSVGSGGHWWSSTVINTSLSYYLGLYSSGLVSPQYNGGKYSGHAVRCMAQ